MVSDLAAETASWTSTPCGGHSGGTVTSGETYTIIECDQLHSLVGSTPVSNILNSPRVIAGAKCGVSNVEYI